MDVIRITYEVYLTSSNRVDYRSQPTYCIFYYPFHCLSTVEQYARRLSKKSFILESDGIVNVQVVLSCLDDGFCRPVSAYYRSYQNGKLVFTDSDKARELVIQNEQKL